MMIDTDDRYKLKYEIEMGIGQWPMAIGWWLKFKATVKYFGWRLIVDSKLRLGLPKRRCLTFGHLQLRHYSCHLLHKSQICLVSSYYIYAPDPLLCLCCIVNGVMCVSAKFSISVLIAVTTNTQYENWINKVNELKDEIYRVRLQAFVLIYSKELEWNGQFHCQAFCVRGDIYLWMTQSSSSS